MRLVFLLFLAPSLALAEVTPQSFLDGFFNTSSRQSYYASYVNIRPSGMRYYDVYQGLIDDQLVQRTTSSGESKQEIVKTSSDVIYYDSELQQTTSYPVTHKPSELRLLFDNLKNVQDYYSVNVIKGAERVAERETYRLSVMAQLPGRYSRVYWIDQEHAIVLRIDVLDDEGQLVERIRCTALIFGEQERSKLTASDVLQGYKQRQVLSTVDQQVSFNWIPDAFNLVSAVSVKNGAAEETDYLLSDGFATLEVIVNPMKDVSNTIKPNHQRDAWQKFVSENDGQRVFVSGDAPLDVVKKIALQAQVVAK